MEKENNSNKTYEQNAKKAKETNEYRAANLNIWGFSRSISIRLDSALMIKRNYMLDEIYQSKALHKAQKIK